MPTSVEQLLVDTSTAVARVSSGNVFHHVVKARLDGADCGLAGHAHFEFISVLTRIPPPQRVSGAVALKLIERYFPSSYFLEAKDQRNAADALVTSGVVGGAIYDGLVGLAAKAAGLTLVTCDRRAEGNYRALGVPYELLRTEAV